MNIIELLLQQAKTTPDRDALRVAGESISFATLLVKVQKLATHLAQFRDTFPSGSFLPLEVPQTIDSYATVLAALDADVPLALVDPSTPPARRDSLLRLYSARRMVTLEEVITAKDLSNVFQGDLHHSARDLIDSTGTRPILGLTSSGTTGFPKVVALDERAVSRRMRPDLVGGPEGWAVTCSNTFSPVHFGGGLWRLGDVLHGITLHVMNLRESLPSGIITSLHEGAVDGFRLPSDVLRLFGKTLDGSQRFSRAKFLKVGIGQGVWANDVRSVEFLFPPQTILLHGLSATESGEMFRWQGSFRSLDFDGRVPIGHQSPGAELRIEPSDDFGPGVGEVVVQGERVALGYISESPQAGRFVTGGDGQRTWLSGDLVKRLENGWYSHVSRIDDVVKVLGRFVSPSEIDATTRRFPGVTESVTMPMLDGSSRLETFVEIQKANPSIQRQLREHLQAALPAHMIPARLIAVEHFPRNGRGKVDRSRLRDVE